MQIMVRLSQNGVYACHYRWCLLYHSAILVRLDGIHAEYSIDCARTERHLYRLRHDGHIYSTSELPRRHILDIVSSKRGLFY